MVFWPLVFSIFCGNHDTVFFADFVELNVVSVCSAVEV